jgi:hypothetical protein
MEINNTKDILQWKNYQVLVREEADSFILSIPELGLIVFQKNLEEGYRELQIAKESQIKNFLEAGMGSVISEPSGPSGLHFKPSPLKNFSSQMMTFTAKALIVLLLFIGINSVALVIVGNIASKGMGRLSSKIERYQPLDKAITKIEGLSDAKVEEIGRQLRRVSKKLQPLVKEIVIILESERLNYPVVNHLDD